MHMRSTRTAIASSLAALLACGSLFVLADAEASAPSCVGGVLATDASGDDTYGGQTGTGLESSAGDIVSVATSLTAPEPTTTTTAASTTTTESTTTTTTESTTTTTRPGKGNGRDRNPRSAAAQPAGSTLAPSATAATLPATVTFTIGVRDLVATSGWNFDLWFSLDLADQDGTVVTVTATRSSALGASGTIDGSSDGVSATFDEQTDQVTISGPSAAFAGFQTITLQAAEAGYSPGAVVVLSDRAAGDCTITLDPDYVPPTGGTVGTLDVKALVIDTGLNGQHPEFADDQVFGWWDFSSTSADPTPDGQTWQDRDGDGQLQGDRDDPYDQNGHGSATSSMLAGVNASPSKSPSACPGCAIAMAKVANDTDETLDGSLADAIHWGVDTLAVDVISVSIGSLAPLPRPFIEDTYAAISYARDHGVLVLFANGNGWGNAGVPGQPGGFMPYGNSTDVLSVGADGVDSFLVTTDPEVVAVFTVVAAGPQGGAYQDISGTSFSTPFTAGVAARLIGEGRACQSSYDLGPDSLEQLIKYTAQDRLEVPPSFEGYGVVTLDTLATALGVVCGGDALPTPDPLNDFYVTNVSGAERSVANGDLVDMTETPFTGVSGPLVLGSSVPAGPKDAEVFRLVLAPGETLTAVAEAVGGVPEVADFDMALFRGTGPEYAVTAELASSGNGGAAHEELTWTNASPAPVTVSLVVYGWSIVGDQPFTLSGLDPDATRAFDGYVVADNLVTSLVFG